MSGRGLADLNATALYLTAAALCLAGCGGSGGGSREASSPPAAGPPAGADAYVFVGVDVAPMDSEILFIDQTVVVSDRRITGVGPSGSVAIPEGAQRIDGSGRVLMPGLTDMHVHLDEEDLPAYLASGITSVRNMWGYQEIRDMSSRISAGALPGPTVYSTSPGIDGPPAKWPFTQIVETPAQAEATMARLVRDGWTKLKVYQDLRPEVYDAVVRAAGDHGVAFMGHVPHRVGLQNVLQAGQASLEHLGGFDVALGGARGTAGWLNMDRAKVPQVVTWTWEAGAYVCPTLMVVKTLTRNNSAPDDAAVVEENRRFLVGALHRGSVPILLGTDSGIGVVSPGESLHQELAELTGAGLTPYTALAAGTVVAAAFLGQTDEFGAVREGLRADLLLLDGNPLEDVGAAARPAGVMVNGRWYTAGELAALAR